MEKKLQIKINFEISPKELRNIVKSEPLSNSHDDGSYAVYYYANVEDPLGIKRQFNSFAFSENNAVFDNLWFGYNRWGACKNNWKL